MMDARKAVENGPAASQVVRDSQGWLQPGHGMGRPKGALNRETKALRSPFLENLDILGGSEWLATFARSRPEIFVACLARMLPREVASKPDEDAKWATPLHALTNGTPPPEGPTPPVDLDAPGAGAEGAISWPR